VIYRAIKNLKSTDAVALPIHPSELDPTYPKFKDKGEFRAWCANENTEHAFISAYEGQLPGQRVTGWDGSNPPAFMGGIIIDLDGEFDYEAFKNGPVAKHGPSSRAPWLLPTWYCRTFSGGARLIWEFEKPIPATSETFLRGTGTKDAGFIGELVSKLKITKYQTTADIDKCSYEPQQYYEVATCWEKIGGAVPASALTGAIMDISKKIASSDSESTDIPMEDIAAEVERVWPGRWKGKFEVGVRGPLFWLEDGIQREGCLIGDHGMVVFSTRSDKAFLSWGDLLGWDFVKRYKERKLESATGGMWWNPETGKYYRKAGETWVPYNKDDIAVALAAGGLSKNKGRNKKSMISEVEEALLHVRNNYICGGIAPIHYLKDDHEIFDGKTVLNSSTVRLMPPAGGVPDPSKFPWVFSWLDNFFEDTPMEVGGPRPRDHFLLWLQHFYKSARDNRKGSDPGMAIIIIGKANTAKTFFSQRMLPMIMAGLSGEAGDVTSWMQGKDAFNKELFEKTVWSMDDPPTLKTAAQHTEFSESIKRIVAGASVRCRGLYASAVNIPWKGRIILTANMDSDFVSALPNMDMSTKDKIMIFKVSSDYYPNLGKNHEVNRQMLIDELPHFLDWLLAWTPPAEVLDNDFRFGGVVPYHSPEVMQKIENESPDAQLKEILNVYREAWSSDHPKDKSTWHGSATELLQELSKYMDFHRLSNLKGVSMGRLLHKILRDPHNAATDYGILGTRVLRGVNVYEVTRSIPVN